MQNYFGEHDAERCGICDLCLKRKRETEILAGKYKIQLLDILKIQSPIRIRDLVNKFSMIHKEQIMDILQVLESERLLKIDHELITLERY